MDKPPCFFVPGFAPDEQEAAYAHMAAHGSRPVPPMGQRIYSLTFRHDGIVWTATVGSSMRGVRAKLVKKVWKETPVSGTVIAAIFPGPPYVLFHQGRSVWENPFYAGDIKSVTRFSAD